MKIHGSFSMMVLAALILCAHAAGAESSQVIQYQAVLTDSETNTPVPDGSYTIVFSIYDVPVAGEPLWSEGHDVQMRDGVCSVELGATSPIGADLARQSELYLGIRVGEDTEMTPRQRLVAVVSALHASDADRLGGVDAGQYPTADALRVSDESAPNEGSNLVSWHNLTDVPPGFADGVDDAATVDGPVPGVAPGATVGGGNTLDMAYDQGGEGAGREITADAGAVNISGPDGLTVQGDLLTRGKVGIGTTTPSENLVVGDDLGQGTPGNRITVGNAEGNSGLNLGESHEDHAWLAWLADEDALRLGTRRDATSYRNNLVLRDGRVGINVLNPSEDLVIGKDFGSDLSGTRVTIGNGNGPSGLNLGENIDNRAWIAWLDDHDAMRLGTRTNGATRENNLVLREGRVGVGTLTPSHKLNVRNDGDAKIGGNVNVSALNTVLNRSSNEDGGAVGIGFSHSTNSNNVGAAIIHEGTGNGSRGKMHFATKAGSGAGADIPIRMTITRAGRVGIGTQTPSSRLVVQADDPVLRIQDDTTNNSSRAARLELLERASGNFDGGAYARWNGDNNRFYIGTMESGDDTNVFVIDRSSNNVGIGTQQLDNTNAKLRVGGGVRVDGSMSVFGMTQTECLNITGGCDLAEPFDVTEGTPEVEPGSVMVIDAMNPGHLKPSRSAYDRRVAGVVSGAGGVRTGMTLSQTGVLEGDTNVALTGRVYVKASTENGPIRPGDLLTSASTPGHAMRADDPSRSHGSIIGKAMTALESGQGLVLVLVNLQ